MTFSRLRFFLDTKPELQECNNDHALLYLSFSRSSISDPPSQNSRHTLCFVLITFSFDWFPRDLRSSLCLLPFCTFFSPSSFPLRQLFPSAPLPPLHLTWFRLTGAGSLIYCLFIFLVWRRRSLKWCFPIIPYSFLAFYSCIPFLPCSFLVVVHCVSIIIIDLHPDNNYWPSP